TTLKRGISVMKKVLYGTTALVAAGLVAGEASAASGLKLGITGFYRNAIGGSFGNSPTTQHGGTGPLAQGTGVTTSGLATSTARPYRCVRKSGSTSPARRPSTTASPLACWSA